MQSKNDFIFIDANQYLDLYRIVNGRKLHSSLSELQKYQLTGWDRWNQAALIAASVAGRSEGIV